MRDREFNAEEFHSTVYDLVRLIPEGRVTTYGHLAKVRRGAFLLTDVQLAGWPNYSRSVGAALKFLQDDTVPWHRVIGSGGIISERGDGGAGAARQAERLRAEGVEVVDTMSHSGAATPLAGRGRYRVASLRSGDAGQGWFPTSV